MPSDKQNAEMCYSILKQVDLRWVRPVISRPLLVFPIPSLPAATSLNTSLTSSGPQIDWNKVAEENDISNGHAARMRYSRLRSQLEGSTPQPRGPRTKKSERTPGKTHSRKEGQKKVVSDDDEEGSCNAFAGKFEGDSDSEPLRKKWKRARLEAKEAKQAANLVEDEQMQIFEPVKAEMQQGMEDIKEEPLLLDQSIKEDPEQAKQAVEPEPEQAGQAVKTEPGDEDEWVMVVPNPEKMEMKPQVLV